LILTIMLSFILLLFCDINWLSSNLINQTKHLMLTRNIPFFFFFWLGFRFMLRFQNMS
jgi:hypothetical protein